MYKCTYTRSPSEWKSWGQSIGKVINRQGGEDIWSNHRLRKGWTARLPEPSVLFGLEYSVGYLSPDMGRGIDSRNRVWNWVAKLQRLAGLYDNPMPTWFLAPIAGLKFSSVLGEGVSFCATQSDSRGLTRVLTYASLRYKAHDGVFYTLSRY
jgi:hypothetical protein